MLIPKFPRSPYSIRLSETTENRLRALAIKHKFINDNGTPRISDFVEAIGLQRFIVVNAIDQTKEQKSHKLLSISKQARNGLEILAHSLGFVSVQDKPKIADLLAALGGNNISITPIEEQDKENSWYVDGYEDGYNKEAPNYSIITGSLDIEATQKDYCLYMSGYYSGLHKRITDEKG